MNPGSFAPPHAVHLPVLPKFSAGSTVFIRLLAKRALYALHSSSAGRTKRWDLSRKAIRSLPLVQKKCLHGVSRVSSCSALGSLGFGKARDAQILLALGCARCEKLHLNQEEGLQNWNNKAHCCVTLRVVDLT